MLIEATALSKSIGPKDLFHDLTFTVDEGEKIALIGRNGQGKTTLLKIITGEDSDVEGTINKKKNLRLTLTKQEHIEDTDHSPLTYILNSVPDYYRLEKILHDFEIGILTDIHAYSEALELFTARGYFFIKEQILNTLASFQITNAQAHEPLHHLSGGEKRYVELTRMMYSQSELFLIDEPTNHMDYKGKEQFITWLQNIRESVIVVTHDRDVLKYVTKIIELKDKKLNLYNGNYDSYISQNTSQTTNSIKLYADQLNRLKEAKKRVEWGLQMRAKSKEWKTRYDHWLRDYEKLKQETVKPSFWIDQESTDSLDKHVLDSYEKFKEKNISIAIKTSKQKVDQLISVKQLSLGYADTPLFSNLTFGLRGNDRVFIKGKNGAGKSTLVRTIISTFKGQTPTATHFDGQIIVGNSLRIGEYEQEIGREYLQMTLEEALLLIHSELGIPMEDRKVKSLMSQYLFDPIIDGKQKIINLSGGQKARFQLIKMFASQPNLLILDEPTNHLDLPSIEELEKSLRDFQGGILYISHDTYFINTIGGEVIEL
jgi:ATPase subunit of ABC transporter with duplicated ATPase domains